MPFLAVDINIFFFEKQLFVSIREEQEIFSSSKGSLCFDIYDKNHWLSIIQLCWQAASLFCYCR